MVVVLAGGSIAVPFFDVVSEEGFVDVFF